MFTIEAMDRVQKAVTMPVHKNDAHNDVEVIIMDNILFLRVISV